MHDMFSVIIEFQREMRTICDLKLRFLIICVPLFLMQVPLLHGLKRYITLQKENFDWNSIFTISLVFALNLISVHY